MSGDAVNDTDVYPLSIEQEMVGRANAWVPLSLRVEGRLDLALLSEALDWLARRHQPLRLRLRLNEDASISQRFDAAPVVPFEVVPGVHEEDRPSLGKEFFDEVSDLTRDAPIRVRVLEMALTTHAVLVNVHHLAIDGCGYVTLVKELWALYEALELGEPGRAPAPPGSYAQHVRQERAAGDALAPEQVEYWAGQFRECKPFCLPHCEPGGGTAPVYGDLQKELRLSEQESAELAACAREGRLPQAAVILGAVAIGLLAAYGQEQSLMGYMLLGRDTREAMGMIGCFTRPTFLRLTAERNSTPREVAKSALASLRAAEEHARPPFSAHRMVLELHGLGVLQDDDLNLFGNAVVVNYVNASPGEQRLAPNSRRDGELVASPWRTPGGALDPDLSGVLIVNCQITDKVVEFGTWYDGRTFAASEVERFFRAVNAGLHAFRAGQLDTPVAQLVCEEP